MYIIVTHTHKLGAIETRTYSVQRINKLFAFFGRKGYATYSDAIDALLGK